VKVNPNKELRVLGLVLMCVGAADIVMGLLLIFGVVK
jgi:hypothetical protein